MLLSQVHRLRALVLLGRFLDMGSWAVDLALSVGIFPYVLKLLQTTASDLRTTLILIWTKILALDKSCQVELRFTHGCVVRRESVCTACRGSSLRHCMAIMTFLAAAYLWSQLDAFR